MTDQTPDGLGERGRALWERVTSAFELEPAETELLLEVVRTVDGLDALQAVVDRDGPMSEGSQGQPVAHPALQEIRAHRLVLSRLVSQLALPDEVGQAVPTGRQVRGRQAAAKRWAGHVKDGRRGASA